MHHFIFQNPDLPMLLVLPEPCPDAKFLAPLRHKAIFSDNLGEERLDEVCGSEDLPPPA